MGSLWSSQISVWKELLINDTFHSSVRCDKCLWEVSSLFSIDVLSHHNNNEVTSPWLVFINLISLQRVICHLGSFAPKWHGFCKVHVVNWKLMCSREVQSFHEIYYLGNHYHQLGGAGLSCWKKKCSLSFPHFDLIHKRVLFRSTQTH